MPSQMNTSHCKEENARMVSLIRSLSFHVEYLKMNKEEEFGIAK